MEIIIALICISLTVALIFLASFIWGVKDGQFEDMHTPSIRILFDNKTITQQEEDGTTEDKTGRN